MVRESSNLSCAPGVVLLVSSVALQLAFAVTPEHQSHDLPCPTSACLEGLEDGASRGAEEGCREVEHDTTICRTDENVPTFYLQILRWTKYVSYSPTAVAVVLGVGARFVSWMGGGAAVPFFLQSFSLLLVKPTFALIWWLMVSCFAAVCAIYFAYTVGRLSHLFLALSVGSGVTSLLAAALLLHLGLLESMPTLLWFSYYMNTVLFVFALIGLGGAALALGFRVVMRHAMFEENAATKNTIVVCLAPAFGCFLCCSGMSIRPFCEYIPFWLLVVALIMRGKRGVGSFLLVQFLVAAGWHMSPKRSLIRALVVGFVDIEPLLIFMDLVCELAVVQLWRTRAAEKLFASIALSSGWVGLALCGRYPAPVAIFYRFNDLRDMFMVFIGNASGGSSRDWAPDKYMSALLTSIAFILFLVSCWSPDSQSRRILRDVTVRINNTDLEQVIGPASSELVRPILRRMPTARTMKRLSDFPKDARQAKRRRIAVDEAHYASPTPASVVRGLCSVSSAAALREVLNQLTQVVSVKATRTWHLRVRRSDLLSDALAAFSGAGEEELMAVDIKVAFVGEHGIDVGGVKRDFFTSVAKEFKSSELLVEGPDQCLLPKPTPAGGSPGEAADKLQSTYRAIGRFVAVALLQKQHLPLDFSHLAYKILLGLEITAHDIKAVDPEFFQNRIKILLEDDGVQKMEAILMDPLFFMSAETRMRPVSEPLKLGGERLRVTEENKFEYVRSLCQSYVLGGLHEQIRAMRQGFYNVLPLDVLKDLKINELDLGLMLAGIPVIDVADWKAHTREGRGHNELKKWFWEIVAEFDDVQRARLLSFATGAARVPPGGFAEMRFQLEFDANPEHVPTAHTCVNMLKIPLVASKEALRQKLDTVLSVSDYAAFGFG